MGEQRLGDLVPGAPGRQAHRARRSGLFGGFHGGHGGGRRGACGARLRRSDGRARTTSGRPRRGRLLARRSARRRLGRRGAARRRGRAARRRSALGLADRLGGSRNRPGRYPCGADVDLQVLRSGPENVPTDQRSHALQELGHGSTNLILDLDIGYHAAAVSRIPRNVNVFHAQWPAQAGETRRSCTGRRSRPGAGSLAGAARVRCEFAVSIK